MLYLAFLCLISCIGPATAWWMWTTSWPEKYRRLNVPVVLSEPYHMGTDWKGMVL